MSRQASGSEAVCSTPSYKQLDTCIHLLTKIVNTQNANMLPSRHQSLLSDLSLDSLSACWDSWQEVTIRLKIMPVLITAVARVMYLISTGAGPASLTDGSTAGELLKTLSYDLLELLRRFKITTTPSNTADRPPEGRWSQILAVGLLPVLTRYSQQVLIPAVHKLAAATGELNQQQPILQKQQQRFHKKRSELIDKHSQVAAHVWCVISFWKMLLQDGAAPSSGFWQLQPDDTSLTTPLPIIIQLAATAVPLLCKGLSLTDSSTASRTRLTANDLLQQSQCDKTDLTTQLRDTLDAALDLSEFVCTTLSEWFSCDDPRVQTHLQQILLSDRLLDLLLILLSDQTAGLRLMCLQQSTPAEADEPEPSSSTVTAQQQQVQTSRTSKSVYQHGIFSSHKVLLTALGIHVAVQEAGNAQFRQEECAVALSVTKCVLDQYISVATCSGTNIECQQQQQQGRLFPIVPPHLNLPAIKMLIEMALLLPSTDDLDMMEDCLGLVLLLILAASTPVLTVQASQQTELHEAAGRKGRSDDTLRGCNVASSSSSSSSTADTCSAAGPKPWSLLSSTAAAALLHPVLYLLSGAVMGMLRASADDTSTSANHQQVPAQASGHEAAIAGKRRILSKYGHLLITVCQSVEPKHIAAVLKSDWPLNPIAALDAVIRNQTDYLDGLQEQQQQQQSQSPTSTLGIDHRASEPTEPGTTEQRASQEIAAQYLCSVTKVAQAVHLLAQTPLQQICAQLLGQSGAQQHTEQDATRCIIIRLFVVAMTLHKVQQTAAMKCKQHTSELVCSSAASIPTPSLCGTTGVIELPACLVAGTDAVVDIAHALSTGIMALHSSSTSSTSERDHPDRQCDHQQHTSDTSREDGGTAAGTDDHVTAMYVAHMLSLPVVLLLTVLNAAGRQMLLEAKSVTQLAGAAKAGATGRSPAGQTCAEPDGTAVSALLPGITTSLLSVVNMVDGAVSMLKQLHGWQPQLSFHNVHCNAAVAVAVAVTPEQCDSTPSSLGKDRVQHGHAPWHNWQQQQEQQQTDSDNLQKLGCLGRAILTDCEGIRPLEQSVAGSSNRQTHQTIPSVRANCPAGSSDSADESAGVVHESGESDAAESVVDVRSSVTSRINAFCTQLNDLTQFVVARIPGPFCCNNPSCLNLSKLSEYQLVSGKACVCGGCKVARYCSRECQKKHWKMHKSVCQQLQPQQQHHVE